MGAPFAERAALVSRRALAEGTLQPRTSELHRVVDAGVEFQVRVLTGPDSKPDRATPAGVRPPNPFLPPDPGLVVGSLSATHVCVLNKYPVVAGHLLVVSREFEPQQGLPTPADLAALWILLEQIDGLGFYNSDDTAGASQPHKHLQLVPPLDPGRKVPVEPLLDRATTRPGLLPELPFAHAAQRLEALPRQATGAGEALAGIAAGLRDASFPAREASHNLLLTRDWMLLVPRSRSYWTDVSVNALGFAGSLVVSGATALAQVRRLGPIQVLKEVGFPRGGFPPAPRVQT
jgi:ATP adenylyltransferase